jgi:hypothetical protein
MHTARAIACGHLVAIPKISLLVTGSGPARHEGEARIRRALVIFGTFGGEMV